MKIKYLMSRNFKTLGKSDLAYKACLIMFKYKQFFIPVIDKSVIGVISMYDIIKFYAKYKTLNVKCGNILNKRFYHLDENDSLDEASELFSLYDLSHILIFKENVLTGILSIKDLTYDEEFLSLAYNAIKSYNIS